MKIIKDKTNKKNKKIKSSQKSLKISFNLIKKFEEKINKMIEKTKKDKILPICFENVIDNLRNNLFEFNASYIDSIFGDFTSIFKTGILTEKIFCLSPLIIENLPNLPTAVIERCNDLFNYNAKINLNEDTCNTFTNDKKEILGFSNEFRVLATSSELAIRNLSDAAQSRFTLIYTTAYSSEERDLLIQIFYNDIPKEFYSFLNNYKNNFRKELSFLYVSKILNILKLINLKFKEDERYKKDIILNNLCLSIHLSLKYYMNGKKNKR